MDRKLPKKQEIEQLIRLSDNARSRLEQDVRSLKHRLDVPARLRDSLKSHPSGWLLGSLASGFVASMLMRRKSAPSVVSKKNRSLPLTLMGLALTAVRPLAKVWLTGHVKNYLTGPPPAPSSTRPISRPTPP